MTRDERDTNSRSGAAIHSSPVLVLGLGATGLACVRFLRLRGIDVIVCDSRQDPPNRVRLQALFPEVELVLGNFDASLVERCTAVVVSPGISFDEPILEAARRAELPVFGDIEVFASCARAPIVAVTGSNGKSTVVTLVAEMLRDAGSKVALGGNLGPPALDLLETPELNCGVNEDAPDFYVLELSSFQIEAAPSLSAKYAAVLNVSADHLDRHAGLEEYAAIKEQIFANSDAGYVAVVNLDDPIVRQFNTRKRRVAGFSLTRDKAADAWLEGTSANQYLMLHGECMVSIRELKLSGLHNVANVLAAMLLARACGATLESIRKVARQFEGLAHRCRLICEREGVAWYNDSKGTNVGASVASVEGLGAGGPVILLAGGIGKGQDFNPLGEALRKFARALVLFGRDASLIAQACVGVPTYFCSDLASAMRRAKQLARRGDRVLLSPACASFDMFESYEARGDLFERLALEICGEAC